jgi:hypothetical protein
MCQLQRLHLHKANGSPLRNAQALRTLPDLNAAFPVFSYLPLLSILISLSLIQPTSPSLAPFPSLVTSKDICNHFKMKFFSIAVLATIAVPALAQLAGIPSCAVSPIR